jgi:hypothetical protein
MSFENDGYLVIKESITKDMCNFIEIQFELLKYNIITKKININTIVRNPLKQNEFYNYNNDKIVNNSFSLYSTLFGETLLVNLQPIIEKTVNASLFPAYSFSRIYYHGANLKKHTDRKSCQYSVSLCIKNDGESWPLWLENKDKEKIPIKLNEGDMLIYKGNELPHWRDKYEGKRQIQIFLHYVDKNGDFSEYAFDKRKYIYLDAVI